MIKLFSLKQQKKEEESAGGTKGTSKKASAAQLRIQKDINELNLPKTCEIDFSDQDDLLHFRLLICPDEGFYKGGKFVFSFKVGQGYPHDPPKVKCETMVYHPNIDLEGNVCLNILREDWKPVLTINSIIYGLQYLFLVSTMGGTRQRVGGNQRGPGTPPGGLGACSKGLWWPWDISWWNLVALGHLLRAFGGLGTPPQGTWWPWDTLRWHPVVLGHVLGPFGGLGTSPGCVWWP
uniref:NEDD8-conjugating enzyme UBC12 n=1 Tax=Calidris pygmaea TaxID=425635 RepID=A0A8C3JKB3_9CHAR